MSTQSGKKKKQPHAMNIIAFGCYWCGAGTDDVNAIEDFGDYKLIKLLCSGRVNTALVMRTFEKGADGVVVFGCAEGKCHYQDGNLSALQQQKVIRGILSLLGIEPERFRIELDDFQKNSKRDAVMESFMKELKKLGPSPINSASNI